MKNPVAGFSKLSKNEKINYLVQECFGESEEAKETIQSFWHNDPSEQKVFDEFSENTITNFYLPYGVVPNLMVDGKLYCVPMVIEESSVVAASSKSAKFWSTRGGIHTEIIGTKKLGQVHLSYNGAPEKLQNFFNNVKSELFSATATITENMSKRGGGLKELSLKNMNDAIADYYQIEGVFETCDAMGANFINSVLEKIAHTFEAKFKENADFNGESLEIIMSILSNYTPECAVKAWVECPVADLEDKSHQMDSESFAKKMQMATKIARSTVERAVTHNKGILNGIDGVILATGNDFRVVEACAHAYAARDGQYRGLSECSVKDGMFRFELTFPLALGTVGGLTSLHPMAKKSLEMLGGPSASELMKIAVAIGLAQNFAALRSLVTSGIQKGHMKMHLLNILNHFGATKSERELARTYFENEIVSFRGVEEFIKNLRNPQ